ncbi:hypothetical protein [Flavobacterium filum]|uniref:hypothetical protein n=1 Tax=Flavobacterium filum TaxID=370974 RepID=UPI0023F4F397|nr:hypothetical protein [Flavobacterium filum]
MSQKNYVGNGWKAGQYDIVNLSLNLEKLNALPVNEYGDIKITVASMKEPNSKTGATHTVYENDYVKGTKSDSQKITGGGENIKKDPANEPQVKQIDTSGLPF